MIVDAVLDFFRGLVYVVMGWLPSPPSVNWAGDLSGLGPLWQYFSWLNQYLPLSEAAGFLAIALTVFGGMYVFRAAVWILTKAHILGGASD